MKTYINPTVSVILCENRDVLTLSNRGAGSNVDDLLSIDLREH